MVRSKGVRLALLCTVKIKGTYLLISTDSILQFPSTYRQACNVIIVLLLRWLTVAFSLVILICATALFVEYNSLLP